MNSTNNTPRTLNGSGFIKHSTYAGAQRVSGKAITTLAKSCAVTAPGLKLVSNAKHNDDREIKIQTAVDYIHENYQTQIRMKDLSTSLGMENSKFCRQFSALTGSNFSNFVNKIRIDKACKLLIETDKYISTICYETGYNNIANFNRRFLELKKITPTEYRVSKT